MQIKSSVSLINNHITNELLKSYDIQNIEITPNTNLDTFKDYHISSIQSIYYGKHMKNDHMFVDALSMREYLDVLNSFDVFICNNNISNVVFGNPRQRAVNTVAMYNNSISFFKRINAFTLGLENNCTKYNCNFLTTLNYTLEYVSKLNNPNVLITLDLGSMYYEHEDCRKYLNKNNIKYINHVHVSAPGLISITSVDNNYYIDSLQYILDLGYDKFISLETLTSTPDIDIDCFLNVLNKLK